MCLLATQVRDLEENLVMFMLCLQDVMKEPCVAADGYTYDRQAIEDWMEDHRTSPVTNLPLLNINLLPNHTLHAAIIEWRRRNNQEEA